MLRFSGFVFVFMCGALSAAGQLYYRPFSTTPATSNEPLTIRPGKSLELRSENINPLKYKITITSAYFTRDFNAAKPGTDPLAPPATPTAPPEKTKGAAGSGLGVSTLAENALIAQAAKDRFATIRAQYTDYKKVVGEVNKLYAADVWPSDVAGTFMTAATTAFEGRESSITASEFVSRLNLWHTRLLAAITEYNTQTAAFAAEATRQRTELVKAVAERDQAQGLFEKAERARRNTNSALQRQRSQAAMAALSAKQDKVASINTKLRKVADYATTYPSLTFADPANELAEEIKAWLDQEAKAPTLPTLASAYVAMRTITAPLPSPEAQRIPDGKDELDLKINLEVRPTYQQPPGTSLAGPSAPYERTLYILPRFRVTASVGPYVGGLFDHQFVLANDSLRQESQPAAGSTTPAITYSPRRRIVRENGGQKFDYVGATVLTHFEYHFRKELGIALSLGAGLQTSGFRALLGPSVLFGGGERAVISGGMQLGQVKRLSQVYTEGEKVPVSLQAVPTRDVNATSWFASLTYNLSSTRK